MLRLLVVADNAEHVLRKAIEASDLAVEIDEISTSAEALRRLVPDASGASPPSYDCLLVDQELPGMTGIQLAAELRATGNLTPCVLVAANHSDELMQAAVDAGITDFLWKQDLTPRRLAVRLRFAIRVGRAEADSALSVATAKQAARARDEVLAVVSHDLRGPLHAIGLACEALRGQVTEDSLRFIGAIERASYRAERLITDLLEASAIENGALALSVRPIDAAAVVRQAAADHELLVKESTGSIKTFVPPEATIVTADRDRVLQVLGNLIGNALKHAKGSPIEIRLERRERDAVIAVRDRGPGITPSELPHVFDRYWHGRNKRGGAGLGLAIAKGIVDAHGGSISARSGEPGAEFSFTLPLAR